ncbi:MAG: UvrD-helicase domain-containing protein, partial [Ruminococcus sp.]|nr:UvrD-helicase domain-containing protein [Ruminococcus sp.]
MESFSLQLEKALKFEEKAEALAARMPTDKCIDLICDERDVLLDMKAGLQTGDWCLFFDAVAASHFGKLTKLATKGLTPEQVQEQAKLLEQFKPLRDSMKTAAKVIIDTVNDIGRDIYEPMQTAAYIFSALAEATEILEEKADEIKTERGVADFGDVERMALRLLVKPENGRLVRTPIAERLIAEDTYRILLIDEFQDVNNLQETIFRALSNTDDLEILGSNVFVVGDLKQSIYRFRQSNPALFKKAIKAAEDSSVGQLTEIRLNSNFRSREVIINTVNAVFRTLMSEQLGELEYDAGEQLQFGATYPGDDSPCELMLIEDPDGDEPEELKYLSFGIEELAIANRIRKLLDSGATVYDNEKKVIRPAQPSDFCVLTRSNESCSRIGEALRYVGLKAKSEQSKGYMGSREIMTMVSLLRVIDDPLKD